MKSVRHALGTLVKRVSAGPVGPVSHFAPVQGLREPMRFPKNPFVDRKGNSLVSVRKAKGDLKADITAAVDAIGGFDKVVKKGDRVLVKPNLNSDDPFPASTSPDMGSALTELLFEHGAKQVDWADSSGPYWLPTSRAWGLGLQKEVERAEGNAFSIEKEPWVGVKTPNWGICGYPKRAFEYDKIVWVPCLKAHRGAQFTLSLKLMFGWLHMADRLRMHVEGLQEGIADVNTVIHPNLIIMDGRKAFAHGGPDHGELIEPKVILASGDRPGIDATAIDILKLYPECRLDASPWEYTQIKRALQNKLGAGPTKTRRVDA